MMKPVRLARWGAIALILLSCVGCDQMSKHMAQSRLKGHAPHSYWGDTFRLEYAENPGAFLGLGANLPAAARWTLLIVINCAIALGIAAVLCARWNMPWFSLIACTLLLAGAVGNLIDRLTYDGLVIDFMNMGVGPVRTGIFNVADVAITLGALLLAFPALVQRNTPEEAKAQT